MYSLFFFFFVICVCAIWDYCSCDFSIWDCFSGDFLNQIIDGVVLIFVISREFLRVLERS